MLQSLSEHKALETPGSGLGESDSYFQPQHPLNLVEQVSQWLAEERRKKRARKAKRKAKLQEKLDAAFTPPPESDYDLKEPPPSASESSDDSVALDKLGEIVKSALTVSSDAQQHQRRLSSHNLRKRSSIRKLRRRSSSFSSDTDYQDGDIFVPNVDAWLDSSKTLSYIGGASEPPTPALEPDSYALQRRQSRKAKDAEAWSKFKFEIVRLTHTLKLKGWRRVAMERSSEIDVERLSGALTNAVYVVSPPADIKEPEGEGPGPGRQPQKLLLRIYGPQASHLIDHDCELQILRRLARKHIGPCLLGTFNNGRFEEFFHARTLTPSDLRNPETSVQIAKRMRELHEGIELVDDEIQSGPFVWRNWDKWVDRVGKIVTWLDKQVVNSHAQGNNVEKHATRPKRFVCGAPWPVFLKTVETYRAWLERQYGGPSNLCEHLVFAHNDTQYGNILRLIPSGDSPLLLPANTHKQLVVIDFEYASANLSGLEFANHFTEWCYNYHDDTRPWACNTKAYPTPAEQDRFIRAYVRHAPDFRFSSASTAGSSSSATTTPRLQLATEPAAATPNTSSITTFMLDQRQPPREDAFEAARAAADADAAVSRLMHETRLWRLAISAQWVVWGIMQAKLPARFSDEEGEEEPAAPGDDATRGANTPTAAPADTTAIPLSPLAGRGTDPLGPEERGMAHDFEGRGPSERDVVGDVDSDAPAEEEFDYLTYAHDRALFFWGDALALGVVREEELPAEVIRAAKTVDY